LLLYVEPIDHAAGVTYLEFDILGTGILLSKEGTDIYSTLEPQVAVSSLSLAIRMPEAFEHAQIF